MSSSFSMFSQSREDFLKRKQALITTIRKEKEAHKLIQQPLTHKKTMPNKPRHTKMKKDPFSAIAFLEKTDKKLVTENKHTKQANYVLPKWAQERINSIKANPHAQFDLSDDSCKSQLSNFARKDQVKMMIAVCMDTLLWWLKTYDAIIIYEENISLHDFMKSRLGDESDDKQLDSFEVSSEERRQLMELILRQSDILMTCDMFLKSGCSSLNEKELNLRPRIPKKECLYMKKSSVEYSLPEWALEELSYVIENSEYQEDNQDGVLVLQQLMKFPENRRKVETENKLEKEKKKILKYLIMMKKIRCADRELLGEDSLDKETTESFKTKIQDKKKYFMKKQFLSLFPALWPYIQSEGRKASHTLSPDHEYFHSLSKLEEQQRFEEKIKLEENIIKMDYKLRAYDKFLNSTEEIEYTKEIDLLPRTKFRERKSYKPISKIMTDGGHIVKPKFNKLEYIGTMKKIFLSNLQKSLIEDREAMAEERNLFCIDYLLRVLEEIDYYNEAFNLYMFESQEDSMVNTKTFLEVGRMLMAKEAEIEESQKILAVIKSAIFSLGGLLKFRRLCQTLLQDLAPYEWRVQYEEKRKEFQVFANQEADEVLSHLAVFKSYTLVQQPSLDNLIIFLADTIRNLGPPANYFTSSFQIDVAVRQLELQNLYAFQHLSSLMSETEDYESAKRKLIKDSQKEISKLKSFVDSLTHQFRSKLAQIRETDKRSDNIQKKYWSVVTTNRPLLEAFTLIKSMFDEFIGEEKLQTTDPVEMLDALIEDIVTTQMRLLELPKEATQEIRSFIQQKNLLKKQLDNNDTKLYLNTEKLLKSMKRTWGLSVGRQGHPPRFRSHPKQKKDCYTNKTRTSLCKKVVKRITQLFKPTNQDDALKDTLMQFERILEEEDRINTHTGQQTEMPDLESNITDDSEASSSSESYDDLKNEIVSEWAGLLGVRSPTDTSFSDTIVFTESGESDSSRESASEKKSQGPPHEVENSSSVEQIESF